MTWLFKTQLKFLPRLIYPNIPHNVINLKLQLAVSASLQPDAVGDKYTEQQLRASGSSRPEAHFC